MLNCGHEARGTGRENFDYIDLLGKRFEYGGRGPDAYDCYGLYMEIQRRRGVIVPDVNSPSEAEKIHKIVVGATLCGCPDVVAAEKAGGHAGPPLREFFRQIESPEPFCIVTFMVRPPFTSHVGTVLPDCTRFIHIMAKRSVAVERLDSDDWSRRIRGFLSCN